MSPTNSSCDSDEGLDRSFTTTMGKPKIFNDMVHDQVQIPALCAKILNTPHFHRLRSLKQLGLCYFVFPTGCHNRFEHCLGTSFLAGKYAEILAKNQPELEIKEKDILCLYIAGLSHDLGHGPFSHTWEHFMSHYEKEYSHEEMSIRLLDHMIKENNLQEDFFAEGLDNKDVTFIKECILGKPLPGNDKFVGREENKRFLYQIVSNEDSKIDVDKFDYLLRDCRQLNVTSTFDYQRVMNNSRVKLVPCKDGNGSRMQIVYRKKIMENLEDLFSARFRLHQTAYQHKVTKIIEEMILDGLHAAEPYLKVTGSEGKVYKLSTAWKDLNAFLKLTDGLFENILYWNGDCPKAKEIFQKIVRRDLYDYWCYIDSYPEGQALKDLKAISPNIKLIQTKINYGKENENPLSYANFYEKGKPDQCFTPKFPPPKIEKRCYIVFKSTDSENETSISALVDLQSSTKQKFQEWATTYKCQLHKE